MKLYLYSSYLSKFHSKRRRPCFRSIQIKRRKTGRSGIFFIRDCHASLAVTIKNRGLSLIFLSVATSIDALAVGLSFAALDGVILFPAAVIGVVSFLMTILGAVMGPSVARVVGRKAELLGGSILILVGIKILAEHI